MDRWKKRLFLAAGILAGAFIVAAVGAVAAKNYLNRPDTALREKINAALSEKFGEPARLSFRIPSARLSPFLNLHLELADVEITSATLNAVGARLQQAEVDVSLGRLLFQKKILVRRAAILIPSLTYAPLPDGRWPHEKLIPDKMSGTASTASGTPAGTDGPPVVFDEVDLLISDARISPKPQVTAGMKDLHVNYRGAEGKLKISAKHLKLAGLPTFSGLATTLNAVSEAVESLLGGSLSMAGKFVNKLAGLFDKNRKPAADEAAHQTTEFNDARIQIRFSDGTANLEEAVFSNSEMALNAMGTAKLADGKLDLVARIVFQEEGLKKFSARLVRKIMADGISIPIRGTILEPKFDKSVFLKEIAGRIGGKF